MKKRKVIQTNRHQEYKWCKNSRCGKKFYRRATETNAQWSLRKYCCRACQIKNSATRRGKKNINLTSAELWDACNSYVAKAQERLCDKVKVYSSEDMSQEELRELTSDG
jgi:hypothetical protein